ncbi:MAG TPA: type II secretion system protein GspL [Nitrospirota bacterium]|nr:type II secretion system protein GspL [Nitrospirota bacterium]
MKIVGLNIDKSRVSASLVDRSFRKTELLDSTARSFASEAELAEILKEWSRGWTGAKIVSSVPGSELSQRTVRLPFSDRKRVEKALPFELEDSIPFGLDDVLLEHLVLQDGKPSKEAGKQQQDAVVIGMLLPKAVARRHLEMLAAAGCDPHVLVPSYAGLYALTKLMKLDGCVLLVSGSDLCLVTNGSARSIRSFSASAPTGGLRHALQSLETELKERVERVVVLAADEEVRRTAASLGLPLEEISAELGGKRAADPVSLGLALSDQINFRKGEFAYRLAERGSRKMKRTVLLAGAAAAVLFGVNIGVKAALVQSGYGKLDRELRDIYQKTFPDAKNIADPLRQMRQNLEEAKSKIGALGSGMSVLDIMKAVTDGIPKEVRVNFADFLLEGDRLKLQGEASSFEAIDRIKAELQKAPSFSEVLVQDTRMGVENRVKFRMEIKLKQAL